MDVYLHLQRSRHGRTLQQDHSTASRPIVLIHSAYNLLRGSGRSHYDIREARRALDYDLGADPVDDTRRNIERQIPAIHPGVSRPGMQRVQTQRQSRIDLTRGDGGERSAAGGAVDRKPELARSKRIARSHRRLAQHRATALAFATRTK